MIGEDIEDSLDKLQSVFMGNYGYFPIEEGERKVGRLVLDESKKTVYVTYRGSVNSLFEIFSCLFIWKTNLNGILSGKVHAGLYSAFQYTIVSFERELERLLNQSEVPIEQLRFVIEGYSRGSGLASLTALAVKNKFPQNSVSVLTYSTVKLFDEEAARNYEKILGKHHWSFLCKEDLVPCIVGPAFCGFNPIGRPIFFSAKNSESYNWRVQNRQYIYFPRGFLISWIMKKMIPIDRWDAHMTHTYRELAPCAFEKTMLNLSCISRSLSKKYIYYARYKNRV